MPTADTFDCLPIGEFVKKYLRQSKVSVDPFARNKRWATYTNDLNPDTAAEWHLDVLEFIGQLKSQGVSADLLILDPPYSLRQLKEVYDGIGNHMTQRESQGFYGDFREASAEILSDNATVLSFGWNSIGMGIERGFDLEEILLVCHGRAHNDTICIAERKMAHQAPLFTIDGDTIHSV